MNLSQGAPVYTGAALGCSFCCGRGEVAQHTKELCLAKVLSDAGYCWAFTENAIITMHLSSKGKIMKREDTIKK
jgi:hypothetical protein